MGAFVGGRGQFLKKGKFGHGLPLKLRHTCDNTKLITEVCSACRESALGHLASACSVEHAIWP